MSLFQPALAAPALAADGVEIALPFAGILYAEGERIDYAVHLQPYSDAGAGTVNLYLSSLGFNSGPSDTPASQHFKARVSNIAISRRLGAGGSLGGRSDLRQAEIAIKTVDEEIGVSGGSYATQSLMRDFSIIGRAVEIRMVRDSYADGKPIFKGTADEWESARGGELVVRLRGKALALDVPLQPATYGGTGGTDGTADLEGKSKPVLLGYGRGIQPALEDPTNRLFRIHTDASGDGAPIQSIDRVLLSGVALSLADSGTSGDFATTALLLAATSGSGGADIEPGEFATCLAEGAFRLGADFDGVVMVDAHGAEISGSYLELPGEMAKALLTEYGAQLSESDLILPSFTTLDAEAPWPIHYWHPAGGDETAADALDEIMASVGGTWTDRPEGGLAVYRIKRASDDALLTITDAEIVMDSWEWVAMPREVRPAVAEVTVGFARAHTVSTNLKETTSAADRAFFAEEHRTLIRSQAISRFAETARFRLDTLLTTEAGAQALGDDLLALYDGTARRASFGMKHLGAALTMGSKVKITHERAGVSEQLGLVTGITFSTERHDWTIDVLLEPAAAAEAVSYTLAAGAGAVALTGQAATTTYASLTPSSYLTGAVSGEWWEIPSSGFAGLWQDAAKTTPVTAYDQQVELIEGKEGSYDLDFSESTTLPYVRSGSGVPYLEITGAQIARAATAGGLATAELTVVWAGVADSNRRILWAFPQADASWPFPYFRIGQWRADNSETTDIRWNGSHPATAVTGLTGLATTGCVMKVYAGDSETNSGVYLNGSSHYTRAGLDISYPSGNDFIMFANSVENEAMTGKWYGAFVANAPILDTAGLDEYFMDLMGL